MTPAVSNAGRPPLFALIDSNNFFVSCERVFRPDLAGKPVVVLSSNDGCAVARSNEAKALGIPMGAPAFKYRQLFQRHQVVQFSANFDLYGDFSRRITSILTSITPKIEVYSVDESFLDLSELPIQDYTAWGKAVRAHILQWTGIPVSIGIAPTKTLAKLGSDRAKKLPELGGVLDLSTITTKTVGGNHHIEQFPIEDLWGVGRRLAPRLRAEGVATAGQLSRLAPRRAQQLMGIHGRQMAAELNGTCCYQLEREGRPAKTIASTRTFGEDTRDQGTIEAALANFTATASFRLRRGNQLTRRASFFITTNKHKPGYRSWSGEVCFTPATADTTVILQELMQAFQEVYNPALEYHRAGVMLYDFTPATVLQPDLFGQIDVTQQDASRRRMAAIDSINDRYGKRRIRLAVEDLGKHWQPRQRLRSPRYTSHWPELPTCRINP